MGGFTCRHRYGSRTGHPTLTSATLARRRTRRSRPGVQALDNATAILADDSEPQPDAARCGSWSVARRRSWDDYVVGCPELVGEVASSTASYDLHEKLADYDRYGAREYVAVLVRTGAVQWFRRAADGRLADAAPDADGLYRSDGLPRPMARPRRPARRRRQAGARRARPRFGHARPRGVRRRPGRPGRLTPVHRADCRPDSRSSPTVGRPGGVGSAGVVSSVGGTLLSCGRSVGSPDSGARVTSNSLREADSAHHDQRQHGQGEADGTPVRRLAQTATRTTRGRSPIATAPRNTAGRIG